jgi:hypothetical protein
MSNKPAGGKLKSCILNHDKQQVDRDSNREVSNHNYTALLLEVSLFSAKS